MRDFETSYDVLYDINLSLGHRLDKSIELIEDYLKKSDKITNKSEEEIKKDTFLIDLLSVLKGKYLNANNK